MSELKHVIRISSRARWLPVVMAAVIGVGCNNAPDETTVAQPANSPAEAVTSSPVETATDETVAPPADEAVTPDPAVTPVATPDPTVTSVAEVASTPGDDVHSAIVHARELLESREIRKFMEWYIPVDDLRGIRSDGEMERMVSMFGAEVSPLVPSLLELLEFLEGETPRMEEDGAVAVYSLDEFIFGPQDAAQAAPTPVLEEVAVAEASVAPPGYGDDLAAVLSAAAADLEAGAVEDFVVMMFPEQDAFVELAEQIETNPQITEAMLADLRTAADVTPEMDDSGNVASFTFPGNGPYHQDRVVKFELVAGNWRLFDSSTPIRDAVLIQSQNETVQIADSGAQYELRFERLADNWRMVEIPDSEILISRPSGSDAQPTTEGSFE